MKIEDARGVIESAKKNPEILASDEYIEAQTSIDWF